MTRPTTRAPVTTCTQALAACGGLARLARYQDPDFTAEVYARADGDRRSVAQATGIA